MTDRSSCVMLLVSIAAWAGAADADPRFSARPYVANEIVTLHAQAGIESAVAFAPDERIENIAVGNSASWEVNPNKRANVIFVKPTRARAPQTNMTVITDQHTYLFDLVSTAPSGPVYMLRFTYPDAPKPASPAAPQAAAAAIAQAAPTQPPPAPEARTLSFAWRAAGEKRLLPLSTFDDGQSTFLHWGNDVTLPAILVREASGAEGPVNYTVKGDYIVVEGIPAQLVLRSGKQMATLTPMQRPAAPAAVTASAETSRFQAAAARDSQ